MAAGALLGVATGLLTGSVAGGAVVGGATTKVLLSLDVPDLRAWELLPADVLLLRLSLAPGRHRLAVKYFGHYGNELYRTVREVDVRAGKRTFVVQRVP